MRRKRTKVTVNLYAALRQLRRSDSSRILWVDAPCIDQSNLDERSQQVYIMGDIYSHANEVLIWLGEEHEGARRAFNLIGWLGRFFVPGYCDLVQGMKSLTPKVAFFRGVCGVTAPHLGDRLPRGALI